MFRPLTVALLVGVVAATCARSARADVFAYTDEQGIEHFSNVPSDVRYRLLISSSPQESAGRTPAKGQNWLSKSAAYDTMIEHAAQASTVHAALIRAVIVVESGFNPRAISKRGAIGLMQLRPETARRYGVSDIYDPGENIRAGARYLSDLMALFGSNTELALAAYNAGEGAVARYGGHIPPFKETLAYVPSVLRIYHALIAQQRVAQPG
jgi:soluble lytic murein transglycosylase-like protein